MHKKTVLSILILTASLLRADGLMMPEADDYPKDFLRHRMSNVMVRIHGLVAETAVYSEFENEWTDTTDAVYSFPLPADARATAFYYWKNGQVYKAVLKVRQQSTNPGTGEGGVTAEVNEYLGTNSIRVKLLNIAPGDVQQIELQYVQTCAYKQGEITYEFPLAGGDFTDYPLDHLELDLSVNSNPSITDYALDYNADLSIDQATGHLLDLSFVKPKAYIQNDLVFRYTVDQSQLGVDFYSTNPDSLGGHFNLFVRPAQETNPGDVYPRRVFFLLSNSSSMFGYKLDQSIAAIEQCLDLLNSNDEFNVIVFNYNATSWKTSAVPATSTNITEAKQMLAGITSSWGTDLSNAITAAFNQILSDDRMNAILAFTDGYSYIDPRAIEALNTWQCGIFPVGIGDDISRQRLEMTVALNYGFTTYFDEDDNIKAGILRLFEQISQPIVKNVMLEYGKQDISQIIPEKIPSLYSGSNLFVAGRYATPGSGALSIGGESPSGPVAYDFNLNYTELADTNQFAASIWAKEQIDALERIVEIYGQTDSLKNALIELSLNYNIRCRYTAYIADYETEPDADGGPWTTEITPETVETLPESFELSCYPNPFNAGVMIQFTLSQLDAASPAKFIKIFNALGQLVAVIDISGFGAGFHTYHFDARDFWGAPLPSGIYFIRLQIGDRMETLRATLLK